MADLPFDNRATPDLRVLAKRYAPYVAIALLGLGIISMMIHSTLKSIRVVEKYLPLVNAAMEIRLEATSAHLWFEELLGGDQHEAMETVWYHQDQAKWYANAMLQGGTNQEGVFLPLEAPEMRAKVSRILILLEDFHKITQVRYDQARTSGSGTAIDQQYDSLFLKFIRQSDDIETTLQRMIGNEMVRYKFTQMVLVITVLLFFAGIGIAFRRFDIYRTRHLNEIRQANAALRQGIHERRETEQSLEESQQRYTRLVDNAKDVIYRMSLCEGTIEFINPAAGDIFGYAPEEFYKRPNLLYNLVHSDWRQQFNEKLAAIVDGQPAETYEYQIVDASGQAKWMLQKNAVVRDAEGRPLAIEAMVVDVTEMKSIQEDRLALERQLQQAHKLESLGILAGGIAHDFNNILMIILGNADIALRDLAETSPIRNHLQNITAAVDRAARVVKQMRAYSGEGHFISNVIDLNEFICELAHMLELVISKQTTLTLQLADKLPPMEGDDTQLRQIILNLMNNAAEAIGEDRGEITISTGARYCDRNYLDAANLTAATGLAEPLPEGQYVFLTVADSGGGMETEVQRKLFDPFFTTKFTGRGLGMAEVQGIVRGHRGAVVVNSEVGSGTTVQALFPVFRPAVAATSREPASPTHIRPNGQHTILVVDDEEDVLTVSTTMLENAGFKTITAGGGQAALNLLESRLGEIDCVLLDLAMPGLDGDEVFCKLRAMQPELNVILTSGYDEYDVTRHMACKGLAGFIQKPYSSDKLLTVLSDVLSR